MRYVVCSAWPYINNVPHLGTMIGSMLSGDVYYRFLKLMGEDAIYVSGSDEHGSPIEVEARRRGVEPKTLTDAMHSYVSNLIADWDIEFSNYTRTHNPVHIRFVQEFMMKLYEKGYIEKRKEVLPYCEKCGIFLADRFIEGTCPYCGYERARGDQCENCGKLLHPSELINPRCVFCGSKPTYKETYHWFFKLPMLEKKLMEWLENHPHLDDKVKKYSLNWVKEGLKDRSITRDSKWGVPAPFPDSEGKTIYVWFEALLGYISATKEYYENIGCPEEFEKTWHNPETRTIFFIGKDNIPFHAIIFPAMLMASGENYPLPWRISATEYLLFQEEKFSKSRGVGVWADEALEILPADYWRFALIRMRPEAKDTSFSWSEFYRIVNTEMNDAVGNYIHRVLSFIWSRYGGVVPGPGAMDDEDKSMVKDLRSYSDKVIKLYSEVKLKQALETTVELARRGNQYLNKQAPWEKIKSNPEKAEATLYIAVNSVRTLALLLAPVTPRASEKIMGILALKKPSPGDLKKAGELAINPGHKINKPTPIFRKLPPNFLDKIEDIVAAAREKVRTRRPKVYGK